MGAKVPGDDLISLLPGHRPAQAPVRASLLEGCLPTSLPRSSSFTPSAPGFSSSASPADGSAAGAGAQGPVIHSVARF